MNPDVAFDVITRQPVLVCPKCGVRLARELTASSYLDPGAACPRPQRWVRRAGQRPSAAPVIAGDAVYCHACGGPRRYGNHDAPGCVYRAALVTR